MRNIILNFIVSAFTSISVLYFFATNYVKVVDGVKVVRSIEAPLLKEAMEGNLKPETLAKKKVLIYKAFKKALSEERGIIFVSQGILKSPFEDRTDEVLKRTRYWYAYLLSSDGHILEGGDKQGRKSK